MNGLLARPVSVALSVAGLLALLVAAWAVGTHSRAADLERGKRLYEFYCYQCHAYAGTARTVAAQMLDPPPRDFTSAEGRALTREQMIAAVRDGRPGTGMVGFEAVLGQDGIEAVVDYITDRFMAGDPPDERYHTPENGWPAHERYRSAYPFATGELPVDVPANELDSDQQAGLRLFMRACISCHSGRAATESGPVWEPRAVSYPRGGYDHRDPSAGSRRWDAVGGASPYLKHDRAAPLPILADPVLEEGAALFQENCAFCHARDGTGRNWIGSFLSDRPRDLTAADFAKGMSRGRLRAVIRDGLPRTSMPAWDQVLSDEQIAAIVHYIEQVLQPASALGDDDGESTATYRRDDSLLWIRGAPGGPAP